VDFINVIKRGKPSKYKFALNSVFTILALARFFLSTVELQSSPRKSRDKIRDGRTRAFHCFIDDRHQGKCSFRVALLPTGRST